MTNLDKFNALSEEGLLHTLSVYMIYDKINSTNATDEQLKVLQTLARNLVRKFDLAIERRTEKFMSETGLHEV